VPAFFSWRGGLWGYNSCGQWHRNLEAAGVEFTNGDEPGVKLMAKEAK
jgi:hypothetical protein